jgi:hypothetical protein
VEGVEVDEGYISLNSAPEASSAGHCGSGLLIWCEGRACTIQEEDFDTGS